MPGSRLRRSARVPVGWDAAAVAQRGSGHDGKASARRAATNASTCKEKAVESVVPGWHWDGTGMALEWGQDSARMVLGWH